MVKVGAAAEEKLVVKVGYMKIGSCGYDMRMPKETNCAYQRVANSIGYI
jgi:hypothetical protein